MKSIAIGSALLLVCVSPSAMADSHTALAPGHAAGVAPAQALSDKSLLYIGAGLVVVGIAVGLSSGSSAAGGAVAANSTTGGGAPIVTPISSAPTVAVTVGSAGPH